MLQEQLVHAQILGQLRMERREQQASVAHEHRLAVELAEHLDVRAASRMRGARMNTPRSGISSPASSTSASKLRTWRP